MGRRYRWSCVDELGQWQLLEIVPETAPRQVLSAIFEMHYVLYKTVEHADGAVTRLGRQTFWVNQTIVRKVILYALMMGYKPDTDGPEFELGGMDDKIDLGLNNEGEIPL